MNTTHTDKINTIQRPIHVSLTGWDAPAGEEHDRGLLAEERTMLAWVRTGITLLAVGVGALFANAHSLAIIAFTVSATIIAWGVIHHTGLRQSK